MTRPEQTTQTVEIDRRTARRAARAAETRRRALSPMRIFLMVMALPLTIAAISISGYLRVSDFDRTGSVVHLVAMAGCEVTDKLGFGAFREGTPGYHTRNDPDGDGVACEADVVAPVQSTSAESQQAQQTEQPSERKVGNAKFLRP